jgi:predicted NBD/HSP70 family sugar kinase
MLGSQIKNTHRGDATLLRKVNESAILEIIREDGPITRLEIARKLHISLPTITRIINNSLIPTGLVIEQNYGDSRGGRRPSLLEFNFRSSLIISVYIGLRMVAALADLSGEVLQRKTIPSVPGEEGLAQLVALIQELRADAEHLNLPVKGVCVGAQAIVQFPQGIVEWSPSLGWRNLPLRNRLEQALDLPVVVENEVNLIALGESWRGAGQGIPNFICISLGDGIGAGLILDGQLYRGSHCAAGEIGYLVPNGQVLGQTFDTYGSLENLAGSSGIVRRAKVRLETGELSSLTSLESVPTGLTAEMVLAAARTGDPLATGIVNETVDLLSIAIANLAAIMDPECILLSGDLAGYSDLFIEPIRQRITGVVPATMPDIRASDLKMDAAVFGAVAIILRHTSDALFVQPFPT